MNDADDMEWFFPPCNVRDVSAWNKYWSDQAQHRLAPPLFDMFCDDEQLIEAMQSRGVKTVLCAGNGISQEPRALAAAGFKVTAMDLSPAATYLAELWQFTPDELDRFCRKEQRRAGGSATFVTGSIFDPAVCPGPFDVIIERRMLQLSPEEERGNALEALTARLSVDGLFLSHCHDGGWRPPAEPVHLVERCLRERNWPIAKVGWKERFAYRGRVAWLQMTTG
jgi:hypothetical protein